MQWIEQELYIKTELIKQSLIEFQHFIPRFNKKIPYFVDTTEKERERG
jgi:hypothetical protein